MNVMNTARSILALMLTSPVKNVAKIVGVNDALIDELYVDLKNKLADEKLALVLASQKMVLLPQCLRHRECPAPQDDEGFHCVGCGRCKIKGIMKESKKTGIKTFVLPGGSMIPRILLKYKPKAVIGVACMKELVLGINEVDKAGILVRGVRLTKDGCHETDLNEYELYDLMHQNKEE